MYPPAEPEEPALQPLKLTKRENKKLRTQRRLAMEKERQEMVKQVCVCEFLLLPLMYLSFDLLHITVIV